MHGLQFVSYARYLKDSLECRYNTALMPYYRGKGHGPEFWIALIAAAWVVCMLLYALLGRWRSFGT